MLKSYLGLQQDALEVMGKERQRLREDAMREEHRALRLQDVISSLSTGSATFHPLLWQNKQQMEGQLRHLLVHQVQQSALAKLDLERHEGQVLKQFGRVKGLELLLDKRDLTLRQQQESRDQRQLDELSSLRHRALRERDKG
ncbi:MULTISPECIES: lateral flagellar protein LfiJ [Aeromonas]|uniref:lateral flagellar protein LfiJ n=1 Tax=Aeromonas TaxID=642 RepID=UPI00073B2A0F|nr:lateral flagellar protein LfiJ [Aeromonas salmonicida]KTA81319.1 flagellar protein [Aeromonas salmonicida]MDE7527845.1 lateral flagellar protein LfiJ [Aeromonas salmonicida]MDE7532183.1 lateral flagellar protein LfiJ [Aeromonas salmonicida]